MTIDYRVGDTRDLTAALPDGSVHLVATSPPFLALRSYLPADHEHKHAEIGSEPDPATFIDTLLALTAEWGRVLAPWGSIAIELGDTYSGAGGENNLYTSGYSGGRTYDTQKPPGAGAIRALAGWPRAKSLALIPQLYATSLAYGRNVLTGQPSPAGQWLVRNVIVWHRPNPAVGALGDKYRPSTSYIVVATRSPKRWFDLTAVRTPYAYSTMNNGAVMRSGITTNGPKVTSDDATSAKGARMPHRTLTQAGAPPLDCWFDHDDHDTWTITTQPSRLAHYAMWPAKLAERLILSMCPAEVCTVCGEPRRRIERTGGVTVPMTRVGAASASRGVPGGDSGNPDKMRATTTTTTTIGWTDCGCICACQGSGEISNGWEFPQLCPTCGGTGARRFTPGVVLDPFAGTGTTLAVADLHGRHGIGFDIDARNAQLMDARRAEVARNLFGTTPEIPGQLDIFDSTA